MIQRYKAGGTLLDVGCGTGEFLEAAEGRGFSATGVEPSETAARIAGRRHPVIQAELENVGLPPPLSTS